VAESKQEVEIDGLVAISLFGVGIHRGLPGTFG
jgi:hypothetical protein